VSAGAKASTYRVAGVCFAWVSPAIWPHAVRSIEATWTTEDRDEVTCPSCLHALGSQKQDAPAVERTMTRRTKTPRERAEEQLAAANRAVIRLDRKLDTLKADLATVEREHAAAVRRQQHLRNHPDLPTTGQDDTTKGDTHA
jgi:hypothetical protein